MKRMSEVRFQKVKIKTMFRIWVPKKSKNKNVQGMGPNKVKKKQCWGYGPWKSKKQKNNVQDLGATKVKPK